MLKNGKPFGKDYFDELLERIREIRASERRAYQKITDIFEQCSYDYDKNSEITKNLKEVIELRIQIVEKIYGNNFWEVCLYRGVLENEELLNLLCEK